MKARGFAAWVVGAVAVVCVTSSARAALDPAGDPDTGFDGDGAARTNMAIVDTFAEARGLGFQTVGARAGQMVLVGGFQDGFDFHVALLRLNPDGTQDTSFGVGGEVKTFVGSNDLAEDAAIQPDDKIVVAGFSDNRAMVLRYLPDGALDDHVRWRRRRRSSSRGCRTSSPASSRSCCSPMGRSWSRAIRSRPPPRTAT